MKFTIIGAALSGNKGAAAMLEATIQTLGKRYPDAHFVLLSTYPKEDQKLNKHKNLSVEKYTPMYLGLVINPLSLIYKIIPPLRPLIRGRIGAIREISESDVVLDEGGITFSDGRELYLLFNIASILPAIFLGKKIVKCAQAVGPFKKRLNRTCAKVLLPRISLIIARGDYTYENLKTLGLKNIALGADYAFALEIDKYHKQSAGVFLKHPVFNSDNKVVGISPSVVIKRYCDKTGRDYISIMDEFIKHLMSKNYAVAIIPHSVRSGTEKTHNNDLPLCKQIYSNVSDKKGCYLIDSEVDSEVLRYIIGQTDLFIASRFHAMVSSLAMGVPTMVVGWSHKYAEVLKMFNLEQWAFGYKDLSEKYLINKFANFEKDKKQIKKNIDTNLPKVKIASASHVDLIDRVLQRTGLG